MLHENAKQRLRRLVPTEYEVEWHDPLREELVTETVTLDERRQVRWAREGSAIEYPCIYLQIAPQGEPRGDLGHIYSDGIYREEVADDTVAYRKYSAAPQWATLAVTVAVKQGTKKIPKHVVCDQLAIDCWHEFRFDSDHLEYQGTDADGVELDYAWPMGLSPAGGGMTDLSQTVDEQAIERRQFEFRVEYAYFNEEEVPATDEIEWRLGIDMDNSDAIEDDEWGPWQVDQL